MTSLALSDLEALCHCHVQKNYDPPSTPIIIGVDEVGRGSLFGQMTVAGVILPPELTGEFGVLDLSATPLKQLNDSKKLSEKKRQTLFEAIHTLAQSYVIVDVPVEVIDSINIYQATLLGMRLAIERLIAINALPSSAVSALIDGNATPKLSDSYQAYQPHLHTLIKGDGLHASIACASILAKVHRDQSIMTYGDRYPDYQLNKNKGYASAAHRHAIMTHGPLPEHRKSFEPIRSLLQQSSLF